MKKTNWLKKIFLVLILLVSIAFIISVPILVSGYDLHKQAIGEIPVDRRIEQIKADSSYVSISEISPYFKDKVVESEDRRFYEHFGINLTSTIRAFLKNVEVGAKVEGGSSITQQLAKNMYFSFDKKYDRKIAELLVAFDLEKKIEKDDILELYSNIAYFGEGQVGIQEASRHYYGVEPIDLTETQADELVKTLKSPSVYNPNSVNK